MDEKKEFEEVEKTVLELLENKQYTAARKELLLLNPVDIAEVMTEIIDEISFRELLERKLGVMDLTAAALLENKGLKIHVFDMGKPENLVRILTGEKVGTVVKD